MNSPTRFVSLDQLQQWMQSVITHPLGVEAGIEASRPFGEDPGEANSDADGSRNPLAYEIIQSSPRLGCVDRLRIYGNAYFARLLECLRSEFPALVTAVGEEAFDGLALGYLQAHPSETYSLSNLAARLPEFLAKTRPPRELASSNEPSSHGTIRSSLDMIPMADRAEPESDEADIVPDFADFLIDLARLERTYSEVFDGPGPEGVSGVTPEEMTRLSPEDFAKSRLDFCESVRLLVLSYPVHEYASSVRRGESPSIPAARPTRLVVTRRDYIVRRFEVTPLQFFLMEALKAGHTLHESLNNISPLVTEDASSFAVTLRNWFFDWTAAGLFRSFQRVG